MTEQEFDRKIEAEAANFERRVKTAADRLNQTTNHGWNESLLFHCARKGTFLFSELGLLLANRRLTGRGHSTTAAWCAGVGAAYSLIAVCFWRNPK